MNKADESQPTQLRTDVGVERSSQPGMVVIVPKSCISAPWRMYSGRDEYLDDWEWKIVDGWLEVTATFVSAGMIRSERHVVRVDEVDRVHGTTGEICKDRSGG